MNMKIRSYSELSKIKDYKGRFEYLELRGNVGHETFGFDRYLNQELYKSREWKKARREIIIRDNGCDLGIDGYEIWDLSHIRIHHMNPITAEQIINRDPIIFDPEFLICCTLKTHNAIHYSDERVINIGPTIRRPNDTKLW